MRSITAACLTLALATPVAAQQIAEPKSGVKLDAKVDGMSLLGVGLRTRTFLKVKVYAIGLYVADAALAGPLAAHKGKVGTPAFYKDLMTGDFPKQITMEFLRDVSTDQIRGAFRDSLAGADKSKVDTFVGSFGDTKTGEKYLLRWAEGGVLETTVAGQPKPPIADKAFAAAVLGIWLGDKPIQDDIKKGLISRAEELLR